MEPTTVRTARVADVCAVFSGYSARHHLTPDPEGVRVVTLADLIPGRSHNFDSNQRVKLSGYAPHHAIQSGDILFRSKGTNPGATSVSTHTGSLVIAVAPVTIVRPQSGLIEPEFVAWLLNQPRAKRYFDEHSAGSNIQMIPKGVLESFELDIPSRGDQRLVVSAADAGARELELANRLAQRRHQLLARQLAESLDRKTR